MNGNSKIKHIYIPVGTTITVKDSMFNDSDTNKLKGKQLILKENLTNYAIAELDGREIMPHRDEITEI